jgi:hypothetical protein
MMMLLASMRAAVAPELAAVVAPPVPDAMMIVLRSEMLSQAIAVMVRRLIPCGCVIVIVSPTSKAVVTLHANTAMRRDVLPNVLSSMI